MLKRPQLCSLLILLTILACNTPVAGTDPTLTVPPTVAATIGPVPTEVSITETLPPTPDSAAFASDLRSALVSNDFDFLQQNMGDAFFMRYVGGASGMITVDDAVALMRDSLVPSRGSIAFTDTVSATSIADADLASIGFAIDGALVSTGWGEAGVDHAIVLLAQNEIGEPYFAGLIYARGGFAGVASATSTPVVTGTFPTPSAVVEPNPAPRGASVYETDFKQGWWEHEENNVKTEHVNDGYEVSVGNGPNGGWSFTTQVERSEFYAEISAEADDCPLTNGAYGLIFHFQDDSHFRFFIVWCDGRYSLMERTAVTTAAVLTEGDLPESIDPAVGEHRIGILAQSGTLTMYVDDIRLGAIGVPSMPAGDVGPYVQTLGREFCSVLFTSLTIYQPW